MTTTTEAPPVRKKRRRRGVERVVHIIGIVGRVFVVSGLLLLFFTAYLLWGTGVYTKQQQNKARNTLSKTSIVSEKSLAAGKIPPGHPSHQPRLGDALFALRIPHIGLDAVVVYGVGVGELRKGPGLFPDCTAAKGQDVGNGECTNGAKWPGENGNVAVSGHRTTYLAPFWRINELQKGDTIDFVSGRVRYRYRVRSQEIVDPTAGFTVVEQHGRSELTLTTCNPRFSATQRLIVHADYVGPSLVTATPGSTGDGADAAQRNARPAFGTDVLALAALAVAAALGSLALSKRYTRLAAYATVSIVAAAGIWVAVFPRVVALLPSNY